MRLTCSIIFIVLHGISWAQTDPLQEVYQQFDAIYNNRTDADKLEANNAFKVHFVKFLTSQPKIALNHGFDGLRMFKGIAPDGSFRIFNWNVPLENKHHYECLFVLKDEGQVNIIVCESNNLDIATLPTKITDHRKWPAALYYDLVPFNKKKKNQFLLLGWEGHDALTNRKVIDVITLSSRSIKFGASVFKDYTRKNKRVLFEYSDEATMSLVYDKKLKRIVFDHLAPASQNLKGQYQFYGPDMTFDGFMIKKGQLYFRENISFERGKNSRDNQFSDPRR